ncbi:MAG: hypothetical protein KGK16_17575, partial [Bradyrhizobium sp.]|nr:hypothetical protein [Bradyrhizobium sp.]
HAYSLARPFKDLGGPVPPRSPLSYQSDKHIAGGTRQKWGEHRRGESIVSLAGPADLLGKFGSLLHEIIIQF